MRKYQIFALTFLALLAWCFFQVGKKRNQVAALSTVYQVTKSTNEGGLMSRFKKQLQSVGVIVDESNLPAPTVTYQRLRIRWDAYIEAPKFVEPNDRKYIAGAEFTVLERQKNKGTLPQPRLPELSSEQILVIAVDANSQLRSWVLIADPRLLRAEEATAGGGMKGKLLHHSSPEFFVNVPDDAKVVTLRFYSPKWTGAEFVLELLGTVQV